MGTEVPSTSLPSQLGDTIQYPPGLTREQCGHIRHIHNIASQMDGDWHFMGAREPGQEWDTARRYQLGHMTYAIGAAHYHRLPAMRSMFKNLFEKLINKMLNKEVWDYWYLTSQGGKKMDPDLQELRKPWVDPVCKENIMYSGHLLCMVSLYTMLFHDPKYDQKDSILFDWNPIFFGMGRETYSYTRSSLQDVILKEMEREDWMGVCCEPNMIFIICNQFPILSFRYNDAVNCTNVVEDVLKKYKAAWAKKGMIGDNGLFRRNYFPHQATYGTNEDIGHTVWAMAFMPWNYEQNEPLYPSIADGFLEKVDNRTNIRPTKVANAIRSIVARDGGRHDDPSIINQAKKSVEGQPLHDKPLPGPTFGWTAMWISEFGGTRDLDPLLRHADTYMNPAWSEGGLYYQRSDSTWDKEGNYTNVDPNTGNAMIAYSRLNFKHGQKKMWDKPWTKETVASRPFFDGLDFGEGVDCVRGLWDEGKKAMIATFRSWNGERKNIKPIIKRLPPWTYGVYVDGYLTETAVVISPDDEVEVSLNVGGQDVDLVVVREGGIMSSRSV